MSISILDVQRLAENYDERSPEEIISLALETVDNIAISFSGAEDVVLVDMAVQINPN
ncbi:MAG: phosphoadenosine phosphosulfate reductase, partial [Sedimenticola sp.]|nr:phosphoadenosine phosphosulfate reductase [Sedimenticola sp.]